MSFLGLLVQIITVIFLMYSGYFYQDTTRELNIALILAAPILFMFGAAIKHNAKTSRSPRGFFAMIKMIIVSYIVGVILAAIFFSAGIGLYYILVLRPAEGAGLI
jgi:hypothetical protein